MPTRFNLDILQRCFEGINSLYNDALKTESLYQEELSRIPSEYARSAKNLLHYMSLRTKDIRNLQIDLGQLGLSSLGRLEAHVLMGLESVMAALNKLSGEKFNLEGDRLTNLNFQEGDELLALHTEMLLGPRPENHMPRIMVTLSTEAAYDPGLIEDLIRAGMNVARINSAHDKSAEWVKMVQNVRAASALLDRECRVLFDLGGPKLRTGLIENTSSTTKIKPEKDNRGRTVEPAEIRLIPESSIANPTTTNPEYVSIDDVLFSSLIIGDELEIIDVRGKIRKITIKAVNNDTKLAEGKKSMILEQGLPIVHLRNGKKKGRGQLGPLPPSDAYISLFEGDKLLVTGPDVPAKRAIKDHNTQQSMPASVPCTFTEVFKDIREGHHIYFDDGKIAGVVEKVTPSMLEVKITRARVNGSKLRSDKGINLPDSHLGVNALSDDDLKNLDFATQYVDMVGLSFVREPADVEFLQKELDKRTEKRIGIVLKIETAAGFDNLPALLLAGWRRPPLGVMVARGDLGVELGFERMAEVQEQILWLSEAAHVPVIWATQVLEQMNKTGLPTRGEVTDAAMSARAECVMLNKGPHILNTVKLLDNILTRMQDHNHKKTPMLRRLKISEGRWRRST